MSVYALSAVWERSQEKGSSLLILLALADYANEDNEAWPSVTSLARKARMSERNTQYGLRKLVDDGELEVVEPGGRRDGKALATRYRLTLRMGAKSAPKAMGAKSNGRKPASEMGANGDQLWVQPAAPQPSVEPSVEPSGREERAHAREDRNKLPDGFPDELRPHARHVLPLLRGVAADHNARDVTAKAMGNAMMAQPRKSFVATAYDLASWAADPPHPIKDVVATYRTFLKKTHDLAGIEKLDETGHPVNGTGNGNGSDNGHNGRRRRDAWPTPQELYERAQELRAEGR